MLKISEYQELIKAVNEGNAAISDAITLKALIEKDSILIAALRREIDRKEGVIVAQIEKNKVCYAERDNVRSQMAAKDFIIDTQKSTIAKMAKPKRWGFGVGVGYGYSVKAQEAGPVASVQVYYSLIRF